MNRSLVVGDSVCVRPDAVEALQREGYVDVPIHTPATVDAEWQIGNRRCLQLSLELRFGRLTHPVAVSVWPSQVWLANGTAERYSVKRAARVAEMVARKEAEDAAKLAQAERRHAKANLKRRRKRT